MMRKDAKLSFIIGGILVAVLIVYVLVPGKKHGQGVTLDEGNKTDQTAAAAPDATATPTPDSSADASKSIESPAGAIAGNPTTEPVAKATDPFSSGAEQPKGSDSDKWMLALNHGDVPPAMMTSAPPLPTHTGLIAGKTKTAAPDSPAIKPVVDATSDVSATADSTASTDAPATQPVASGKMNTHVVQAGETISSIAKVAYGSANYWPYIIRANPGIVATKIRPGMTINLPAAADVKSGSAAAGSTAAALSNAIPAADVKIDPATQYQVQPGDSLGKIAMKLYGSSNKWQPIYDLNKEAIGPDPQKLKQKMVLKLPEPPTVKQ